jgi:hypothetical protein
MRILAGLGLTAATWFVAHGASSAQVVDRYDERVLAEIAEGLGYEKHQSATADQPGGPYLVVTGSDDRIMGFQGTVCDDKTRNARCVGVEMYAPLKPAADGAALLEAMNQFNADYYVGKVMQNDDGIAITRYMIMDDGITRRNLEANVLAFEELYRIARDELE